MTKENDITAPPLLAAGQLIRVAYATGDNPRNCALVPGDGLLAASCAYGGFRITVNGIEYQSWGVLSIAGELWAVLVPVAWELGKAVDTADSQWVTPS